MLIQRCQFCIGSCIDEPLILELIRPPVRKGSRMHAKSITVCSSVCLFVGPSTFRAGLSETQARTHTQHTHHTTTSDTFMAPHHHSGHNWSAHLAARGLHVVRLPRCAQLYCTPTVYLSGVVACQAAPGLPSQCLLRDLWMHHVKRRHTRSTVLTVTPAMVAAMVLLDCHGALGVNLEYRRVISDQTYWKTAPSLGSNLMSKVPSRESLLQRS